MCISINIGFHLHVNKPITIITVIGSISWNKEITVIFEYIILQLGIV